MKLRKQQLALKTLVKEIESGSQIEDIILAWSVASGKSLASVILSDLLTDGKKQIVVVPRVSLQSQGERSFLDSFYPTNKTSRIASNIGDPWRGCNSAFVTFQSVCMNPDKWIEIFKNNKVMLIMDEMHHLSEHGDWIKTIKKLKQLSFLTVLMSGSPFRGDNTKIPFLPYYENGELDYRNTSKLRWIIYSSQDALRDGYILPFDSTVIEGSGTYIDLNGITRHFDKLGSCGDNLRCVFDSEYAFSFIDLAFSKWIKHRIKNKFSKMIIVSSSIKIANKYADYIKKRYPDIRSGITTSEDSKSGANIIKRTKIENSNKSAIDCLISVNTAYEGLDIPQCDFMVILTLIRSLQWILQCVGRCQRTYPGKITGQVFAPADAKMIKLLKSIDAGSITKATEESIEKQKCESNESTREAQTIEALESTAHINGMPLFGTTSVSDEIESQSEKETRLRKDINSVVNKIVGSSHAGNRNVKSRLFWMRVKQIVNNGRDSNGKLIRKKLEEMTVKELEKVNEYTKLLK